jgi:aldehyde dehydrogenase (NAD+)
LLKDVSSAVVHGGKINIEKRYVEPTLLANPGPVAKIMQEEIFGPLLPIFKVNNVEEAVNFIRTYGQANPLALYVYGKNRWTDKSFS